MSGEITTPAQAAEVCVHLGDVMEALLRLVQEETELVRAGKLTQAAKLEPVKADMARLYYNDVARIKAHTRMLKDHHPALIESLRKRHDAFHALLQINLTVLATAQAVTEGIVRGVSQEINRKAAPQVYGASGRPTSAPASSARPIAMSRSL